METVSSTKQANYQGIFGAVKRFVRWSFSPAMRFFRLIDRRVDGAASFFFKHYGKTKFMIAMSKKAQVLGVEKLFFKSPKAFVYFFLFYLIRDTILYIIIPIYFATLID